MSVGLNIWIRHSFTDLWDWIRAWIPWPLLLIPCHFSAIYDIRILSIPTMCMLPDWFRILLPQREHKLESVKYILISGMLSYCLWSKLACPRTINVSSYKYFLKEELFVIGYLVITVILLFVKYSTLTCKFVFYFHNCEYYPLPNNAKQTNKFVVLFMFPLFVCLLLVLHGEKYLHL